MEYIKILDIETFERLSEPTDFFDKTRIAMQKLRDSGEWDKIRKERQKTWLMVSNQIVGQMPSYLSW